MSVTWTRSEPFWEVEAMSGMTSDRLEELRRIAAETTPGTYEWRIIETTLALTIETALALLDRIEALEAENERLRREWEVLAEGLKHIHTCKNCECASCPEGTGLTLRAYRALGGAMDLLDGEKGGGGE